MIGLVHAQRSGGPPVNLSKRFLVKPGKKVRLKDRDPEDSAGYGKKDRAKVEKLTEQNIRRLDELQYLLYAENRRSLLIVLQAMDAAGKDGTIRHVIRGLNPQGCTVTSFKKPSDEELDHDFLWRIHKAVPNKGDIGIFNRSHYEDVLVVRVHELVPKDVWAARYEQINRFEELLAENNVVIVKFFLHISKDEQLERFQDRLKDKDKHWKISPSDFGERKYWKEYQRAYEDALEKCSTKHAPWYVIPSNRKWFRNLAVSQILVETLESLQMSFPKPAFDISKIKVE
ncbi:MAG: polyphosphate kinase 2 family protein [Planctomycetota bacterium]|nr:polyphosphate kinase 2 family protein [Planctomycetota bacterium]